jgi:hypothetical protein
MKKIKGVLLKRYLLLLTKNAVVINLLILKTIKLPYKEKEELRQRYKKELKNYRQSVKDSIINKPHSTTAANPVTGDLSRFISTAGNKKNNG